MNTLSAFRNLFALSCACALLCPGGGTPPQRASAGSALAPRLSAASRVSPAPAAQLYLDGKPAAFEALRTLLAYPQKTRVSLLIGATQVEAAYLGQGGMAAVYRFAYEGADYVVKIPVQYDSTVSTLPNMGHILHNAPRAVQWMVAQGYLEKRRSLPYLPPEYAWTPKGREAVVGDDPALYGGLAPLIDCKSFEYVHPQLPGSTALGRALHYHRVKFRLELSGCVAARQEAEGSQTAYPMPELQPLIRLPGPPAGHAFVPEAVVERFQPSAFVLQNTPDLPLPAGRSYLQPGVRPELLRTVVRSAVAELERIHRLGRAHGDVKPSNMAIDAQGRVRFIDWGSSITAQQLLDGGNAGAWTYDFASPARFQYAWDRSEAPRNGYRWNLYNPFFDDYFALAVSIARLWSCTAGVRNIFDKSHGFRLDPGGVCYREIAAGIPGLEGRIQYWRGQNMPDEQAFTVAVLECCGAGTLPAYLMEASMAWQGTDVDTIEREAAAKSLSRAA